MRSTNAILSEILFTLNKLKLPRSQHYHVPLCIETSTPKGSSIVLRATMRDMLLEKVCVVISAYSHQSIGVFAIISLYFEFTEVYRKLIRFHPFASILDNTLHLT